MSHPKAERHFRRSAVEAVPVGQGKVELNLRRSALASADDGESMLVIVKVAQDGYLPENVDLRVRVGPKIFTARVTQSVLHQLENDSVVRSVSVSRRMING